MTAAAPFAALESRLNSAVVRGLSNATATLQTGQVSGIFDAAYQEILGVSSAEPSFLAAAADLAGVARNSAVSITYSVLGMVDVAHTVREIQPDGTGMVRLLLRKA